MPRRQLRLGRTEPRGLAVPAARLEVELDNSAGDYNSPGAGDLAQVKRGSRVNLHIGYKTAAGDKTEEIGRYFIESWHYSRSPGKTSFHLACTDAWGLLERFAFSKPVEFNIQSDDYTMYQLIERLLQGIGATLSYRSRSPLMTALYPRLEVSAGESGATLLRRLLALVEDEIFFFGLEGRIVHPRASDPSAYGYQFP